ncbi:FAD-dependent monooxygenase [Auraticoccus monumenti]|uniref:2-polyprenyl-6-methoxyphenol hydroxylase n=1 Tax=Auraticoccus monumenti TaxID=675864 RepID=A0A1G6V4R9_9ACTN|nr:FAD-dependent monooxygenase [Auraticoccus monumenti]SDD48484.1 2-polyprenyl-6-methoxyphenol hydroxylase [Auraticoccus monumenti]
MAAATLDTDVLVVGAGPTGLMLACWLARLGVDHVLVDEGTGPTRESRAVVLQACSMELYAQLGMVDAVRDRVSWASGLRPGWERRPAPGVVPLAVMMGMQSPHPGVHVLEQSENERLLGARLRELGSDVAWSSRLLELHQGDGRVRALLATPSGPRTVTARWCVGTDGAGSTVRQQTGIAFRGSTAAQTFWVADAATVEGLEEGRITLRAGADRFLLTFPLGPGRHRLIGVLGDGEEADPQRVTAELGERFDVRVSDLRWFSSYRVHHKVAESFRRGRVLLAGDAAHVHSPVGGQGMNTGLQDAHGLAFKLAAVLAGQAGEDHLDHHDLERRPVALRLVGSTDRVFTAVVDRSRAAVLARRLAVPLLAPVVSLVVGRLPVARRLAGYVGQLRIHYWRSPEHRRRSRGRRDPVVGRRLPWTGDNHESLRSADWQVHGYGTELPALTGLPSLVTRTHRFSPRPELGLVPGRWLLVRPDGFVAAAASPARAAAVFDAALAELGFLPGARHPHP